MARLELTDAMVLAAARVSEPRLFAHGLEPLLRDGPNTRKQMVDEESRVRRMLDAAFGATTQADIDDEKTALRAQLVAALAGVANVPSRPTFQPSTPGATWRTDGEPDPHGNRYECERAALTMGDLTDDELANGAFLNYDAKLNVEAILRRDPNYHAPIAWMTAVKDRIRWLSRRLQESVSASNSTWWRKRADELEVQVIRGMSAMACYTQMRQLVQAVAASPVPSPAAQQAQPVFPAVVDGLLWLCTKVDGTVKPLDGTAALSISHPWAEALRVAREITKVTVMPSNEPIAPTPYNARRIWWELERTALGDGYYGNALRVAKDMPGIDDKDRAVLDRWATGAQQAMDHVLLQGVAIKVYATHSTTAQAELASKPEAEDMKVPITTNGTTRMVPREEPVFLIRGQDSVGADAVRAWADLAEAAGAAPTLLQSAREHAEKMDRWPKKKVADNAHPPASSAPMQRALALAQGVAPNAAAILATFCHELVMGAIEEGAVRAAAQRVLVAAGLSRLEQVVAVEADSGKEAKS